MSLRIVPPRSGRSPFYTVRGTFAGRTVDASTKTRDAKSAERFKARLEVTIAKQEAENRSPITFRGAAALYLDFRRPKKADRQYIERLMVIIGDTELADIRQHTLISAANSLFPDAKPGTKNRNVLVPASAVLHYAAESKLCPYIRVRKFKEPSPEPRALSKDQARVLMASAEGNMRLILSWLFCQGWRISDTLRLQWQHIDMKAGTVRYHITKTDRWHVMPLHEDIQQLLGLEATKDFGPVFNWENKSNFYRALRPLCRRLKIHFTPHMARHSFATWLVNDGVSPQEIMEAGGWQDHKSVLRYAKLDPTRIRAVINRVKL
jgi:integrase